MLKKNNHNLPLKNMLNILDNKFKFEIIYYLIQKKMRFGEIKNSLFNINQQLLTKLLKQLEKDKLIKKKEFKGCPSNPWTCRAKQQTECIECTSHTVAQMDSQSSKGCRLHPNLATKACQADSHRVFGHL